MINVIRFRFAILICFICYFIFPKSNFKNELKKIMLKQGNDFRFKNINFGLSLKEQLKEQQNDNRIRT